MNRPLPGAARDLALLLTRLLLGTIMFAHGYQKLVIDGVGRTTQGFESMSIPVAILSAAFVTVVEVVGSALVILGALIPVVAACYLVVMVGAIGAGPRAGSAGAGAPDVTPPRELRVSVRRVARPSTQTWAAVPSVTGIASKPRSRRVGRRCGGAASARSGNRSNSARSPISPSIRASPAPRQ